MLSGLSEGDHGFDKNKSGDENMTFDGDYAYQSSEMEALWLSHRHDNEWFLHARGNSQAEANVWNSSIVENQVQHSVGDDFSESVFSSFTPRG